MSEGCSVDDVHHKFIGKQGCNTLLFSKLSRYSSSHQNRDNTGGITGIACAKRDGVAQTSDRNISIRKQNVDKGSQYLTYQRECSPSDIEDLVGPSEGLFFS